MFEVSSEKVSDKYLSVNNCDCQKFSGIAAGNRRLFGRVDWQLIYIAKGVCRITEGEEDITVFENSVIIYPPKVPQIYCFNADCESVSYYVHFSGYECEKILGDLGLSKKRVIKLGEGSKTEILFEKLIMEYRLKKPFFEENCNGILISLFSHIARSEKGISDNPKADSIIGRICEKMQKNYKESLSVSDYAKLAGLSTGGFIHLFTKSVGISPKQYMLEIKLKKAKELLENTDLPIWQIGELLGFPDSNYFSRIFKKHMSHPPKYYR